MDYDEFKKIAKDAGAYEPYRYRSGNLVEGLCFYAEWDTGGIRGNYYGGRENIPVEPEEAVTSIPEMDIFLSKVVPNISFIQYRLMCNDVLNKGSYTEEPDYYRNYRIKSFIQFPVKAMYDKLCELGVLTNPDFNQEMNCG